MNVKIKTSKCLSDVKSRFVIKNANNLRDIANVPHRHNYYAILWSFNSEGTHIIDGDVYQLEPHMIFFITPGQVHQILPPNPQGLIILFSRDIFLEGISNQYFIDKLDIFNQKQTKPLLLAANSIKKLMKYANRMMDEYNSSNKYRDETIEAYLKLFLIECDKQYSQTIFEKEIKSNHPLVKSFMALVETHYHCWHQVQDYAGELHVTSKYLCEVIKLHLEQSPKEFIQDRIIIESKRYALFTGLTLKEIGYKLGFETPSQFSRFFKECNGYSFAEFNRSANK